jgi:hypothetical protein
MIPFTNKYLERALLDFWTISRDIDRPRSGVFALFDNDIHMKYKMLVLGHLMKILLFSLKDQWTRIAIPRQRNSARYGISRD